MAHAFTLSGAPIDVPVTWADTSPDAPRHDTLCRVPRPSAVAIDQTQSYSAATVSGASENGDGPVARAAVDSAHRLLHSGSGLRSALPHYVRRANCAWRSASDRQSRRHVWAWHRAGPSSAESNQGNTPS